MGTIVVRTVGDGNSRFTAQIFLKKKGRANFRESKTFGSRKEAVDWIKSRERVLRKPGGIEAASRTIPTLRNAIERYLVELVSPVGRSKAQALRTTLDDPISDMKCLEIRASHIVAFARRRLEAKNRPTTVAGYLSHLSTIFTIARPAWDYPLDLNEMRDAKIALKRLGGIGASASRSRRPTLDELDRLLKHFSDRSATSPSSAPMVPIILFALFSTRRQEEIVRITWADLDEAHSRVLVRDMKHPGQKAGNDTWCDLPEPAMRVLKAMPQTSEPHLPLHDGRRQRGVYAGVQGVGG
ncbi:MULTISPECIES: site-specific integrase [unclassified Aureimonas]|uniref:site-specific integrase n=1 Tax=unclassified Aureimonas TaxID=2615206 RepID=UPI000B070C90|nr:site-specific integrase [Aureimonas sp. Leaf427]